MHAHHGATAQATNQEVGAEIVGPPPRRSVCTRRGRGFSHQPARATLPCDMLVVWFVAHAAAFSSSSPSAWKSYCAFNADVSWRGYATTIDPKTAVPSLPGVEYSHFIATDEGGKATVRTTTTIGAAGPDEKSVETVGFNAASVDIDLDGSYSTEHPDGLGLATLLRRSDEAPPERTSVVEHCLAVSDTERRRCLLSYDAASGALDSVLLLVEQRGDAADTPAPSTIYSLCGTWRGDACVRAPTPAAGKSRGGGGRRGFGGAAPGGGRGFGKGGGVGKDAAAPAAAASAPAALGVCRTAVFKAELTYAWDGGTSVARQLCVTSSLGDNSGGALDAIRSTGVLQRAEGAFGEYEAVRFVGDATQPALLLLPAACHVLAPLQLPTADAADAAYSTEFGAVLEPGESFGWRGFVPGADADAQDAPDEDGLLPPLDPAGDTSAPRLVRISRLYAGMGRFMSGSTSLCTAE